MLTLQFVKFFKLAQDKFEAVRACVRVNNTSRIHKQLKIWNNKSRYIYTFRETVNVQYQILTSRSPWAIHRRILNIRSNDKWFSHQRRQVWFVFLLFFSVLALISNYISARAKKLREGIDNRNNMSNEGHLTEPEYLYTLTQKTKTSKKGYNFVKFCCTTKICVRILTRKLNQICTFLKVTKRNLRVSLDSHTVMEGFSRYT